MEVIAYDLLWVEAYVTCGCSTVDDTPLFKVSLLKDFGAFPKNKNKDEYEIITMKLVDRSEQRGGGWKKSCSTT